MYSLKIELYVFGQGQWSSRSKDYFDIQKGTFHLLYGDCPLIVSRKLLVRGLLQDQETVHFDVPDESRGTFRKWTYGRPCVATFGDQACSLKRARWHPCVSNCPRSPSASWKRALHSSPTPRRASFPPSPHHEFLLLWKTHVKCLPIRPQKEIANSINMRKYCETGTKNIDNVSAEHIRLIGRACLIQSGAFHGLRATG